VPVGAVIVAVVLWEVFHDLFHPSGAGALTNVVGRAYFRLLRGHPARLSAAGPLALVTIILVWVFALVVGFALLYFPFFPQDFRTSGGALPSGVHPFTVSMYISAETLTTLGYGDYPPHSLAMRIIATAQGLVGFAILTASVSEIVLIYPALTRMRHLALGVHDLVEAEKSSGIDVADTASDVVLAALSNAVTHARIDLVHFPVLYFFAPMAPDASIANWTGALERFAKEARGEDRPAHVRLVAASLDQALDDLAWLLAKRFLKIGNDCPRDQVFEALARYHGVERVIRA
jgi:hypothetical protein